MTTLSGEFRQQIRTARSLPSPPAVAAQLIELCENPDTGIKEIIDLLSTDATLSARLLRLANSPVYAKRRRTDNLRQAVTLLGIDAVLTASLSLTLLSTRQGGWTVPGLSRRRCWTRSVHAAAAAQVVAEQVDGVKPADAFLAGLLQDIGVDVVACLEPATYESLGPDSGHDDLVAAEIAALGGDHALIGSELLSGWRLPCALVEAVASSHRLDDDSSALSRVVAVSGLIADDLAGRPNARLHAGEVACTLLGVDAMAFGYVLERLATVLPDLSVILDAEAPDPDTLLELAAEAIVLRQARSQSTADELHERVVTLTSVAEELRAENRLDPLTGLSNRRDLDDVLAREFAIARNHEIPLSVLFVDLDDFKKVNDRFGHTVGDELLVQTARRVGACVRDGDLVGRFGGEEFVVVLPGADRQSAEIVARRLIDRFDAKPFDLGAELSIDQTISVGVATHDAEHRFVETAELLHAADVALYAAKHDGKNCWRGATHAAASPFDLATERS